MSAATPAPPLRFVPDCREEAEIRLRQAVRLLVRAHPTLSVYGIRPYAECTLKGARAAMDVPDFLRQVLDGVLALAVMTVPTEGVEDTVLAAQFEMLVGRPLSVGAATIAALMLGYLAVQRGARSVILPPKEPRRLHWVLRADEQEDSHEI